jgi:mono/diheme cytochrome c family protein
MRPFLLLLVGLPLAAQEPALTPFQAQKVHALLRDQLPCLGCHELDGSGGRSAPSLGTVAKRRSAAYIRAIIEDPQSVAPGAAMPKTPMPASIREAVIRYLARNAAVGALPPPQSLTPNSRHMPPSSLYNRWCASCHGQNGSGDGPNAKYLPVPPAVHGDAAKMGARSDDALFDAIAGGGVVMGKSTRMPAFGATLSPVEIRSLVGYIRVLCACAGPFWSRDPGGR